VFAVAAGIVQEFAAGHRGIREVATNERVIALTFDDGPDPRTTPQILKILKEYNAKATFFVMGQRAEDLPEQLRQIAGEGHEVANHGFSHRWLTKLNEAELADEIVRTEAVIMTTAPKPVLFRPPGAYYNEKIVAELKARGYTMIMWSIDTRDWARSDAGAIAREVTSMVKPGSIILMHDGAYAPNSPKAAQMILDQLTKEGYHFITVSEMIKYSEKKGN
jgi:peptidoglycan/xylan/chitin deacetylase (PgdA/CDA1 family)